MTEKGINMPSVFLSPSTQEYNPYVDGGNEEYYMNLIADAMVPYLLASGIEYGRNNAGQGVTQSIAESNAGNYDLHLAIHSNAAAGENAGKIRGTQVYYYPYSNQSQRAANIFANNFKEIYPDPSKVQTVATTSLAEVVRTKAPSVLIEVAYHDNPEDAQWIRDNIENIAMNLAVSVADFLGVREGEPSGARTGIVTTQSSNLNMRAEPSTNAEVIARIPKGTRINILGEDNGWYLISYNGRQGYVFSNFVTIV